MYIRQWLSSTIQKLVHVNVHSCMNIACTRLHRLHRRSHQEVCKLLVHMAVHVLTTHYTSLQCRKKTVTGVAATTSLVSQQNDGTHVKTHTLPVHSVWHTPHHVLITWQHSLDITPNSIIRMCHLLTQTLKAGHFTQ